MKGDGQHENPAPGKWNTWPLWPVWESRTRKSTRLTDQMNHILDYMEKLNELDTSGIEPMAHALDLETPVSRG